MSQYFDGFITLEEEDFIDISSSNAQEEKGKKGRYSKDSNKSKSPKQKKPKDKKPVDKKKIAIISSVSAVLAVAIGVTCFSVFFDGKKYETNENGEFIFSSGTVISGVSVSGKTFEEAKEYLATQQESFIKPKSISVDVSGKVTQFTESDFKYNFDTVAVLERVMKEEMSGEIPVGKTYVITATPTDKSVSEDQITGAWIYIDIPEPELEIVRSNIENIDNCMLLNEKNSKIKKGLFS